jgi:hypothetical protein
MQGLLNISRAAVLIACGLAGHANAATVDIAFKSFSRQNALQAITERDAFIGAGLILAEDFELGFSPCTNANHKTCSSGTIQSTNLGSFSGYGEAVRSGASQVRPKDRIVVRTSADAVFGRYNVTPGGSNWLDSNDREGIDWTFSTPGSLSFQRLAFFLTDLDDVGSVVFSIALNGGAAVARPVTEAAGNARLHLITMLFDEPVKTFTMRMVSGSTDGFGLDGARAAAVPLPAAGLLMLGALGGIMALVRRRRPA